MFKYFLFRRDSIQSDEVTVDQDAIGGLDRGIVGEQKGGESEHTSHGNYYCSF